MALKPDTRISGGAVSGVRVAWTVILAFAYYVARPRLRGLI
jgi:hypothetical protein